MSGKIWEFFVNNVLIVVNLNTPTPKKVFSEKRSRHKKLLLQNKKNQKKELSRPIVEFKTNFYSCRDLTQQDISKIQLLIVYEKKD